MVPILLAALMSPSIQVESILSRPIDAVHKRYNAMDDKGVMLDCLKVEQTGPSKYIGVHHALIDGVFQLRLIESSNLLDWKHVRKLDGHAHQGTLRKFGDQWLLAWEKDGPKGNWIHLALFSNLADLLTGKVDRQIGLPRSLSKFAEGTPSIFNWNDPRHPERSVMTIRFHYWRDGDVDRQAEGSLGNFKTWRAEVRLGAVASLDSLYRGNIGDRDYFTAGQSYEILEAQMQKNDWSSWRILLREGSKPFNELKIVTEKGSRSFANPAVTVLNLPDGKPGIFASYFLPSQGNHKDEAGQLIYFRELSK
ncbi:MAG: hypothetical protein H7Y17_11765 [Chlorobia bacterium]|nr:hypothetical protein [Fimbriimonadaceae bacterium]